MLRDDYGRVYHVAILFGLRDHLRLGQMSFAVQALAAKYILEHHAELGNHVYVLPHEIDTEIAKIKLASMGYAIDTLSEEQRKYLNLD